MIWERTPYRVEANSLEEAVNKLINWDGEVDNEDGEVYEHSDERDFLYDTAICKDDKLEIVVKVKQDFYPPIERVIWSLQKGLDEKEIASAINTV